MNCPKKVEKSILPSYGHSRVERRWDEMRLSWDEGAMISGWEDFRVSRDVGKMISQLSVAEGHLARKLRFYNFHFQFEGSLPEHFQFLKEISDESYLFTSLTFSFRGESGTKASLSHADVWGIDGVWSLIFIGGYIFWFFSPPARWGLLDFMLVDFSLPPAFRLLVLLLLRRTSTASIHAKCSLPDLNRETPRQVFPAGPQPRVCTPNVPCRTSTWRGVSRLRSGREHLACILAVEVRQETPPERMPKDMPDRMPDRTSDGVPDRMSEDTPDNRQNVGR